MAVRIGLAALLCLVLVPACSDGSSGGGSGGAPAPRAARVPVGAPEPRINLCASEQACLVDQVGIAYTRGTSVSEPYNRVSYSGTTTKDPTKTCYSIPTLTVQ